MFSVLGLCWFLRESTLFAMVCEPRRLLCAPTFRREVGPLDHKLDALLNLRHLVPTQKAWFGHCHFFTFSLPHSDACFRIIFFYISTLFAPNTAELLLFLRFEALGLRPVFPLSLRPSRTTLMSTCSTAYIPGGIGAGGGGPLQGPRGAGIGVGPLGRGRE